MSLEGMSDAERDALAALMKGLSDNPETRLQLQATIKKAYPTTSTPELDQALALRQLAQQNAELKARFEQQEAKTEAEKVEAKKWGEAVGAGHCEWSDMDAIRAFMTLNGIMDIVRGAELWKQSNQLATPTSATSATVFEMPQDVMAKFKTGGIGSINRASLAEGHAIMGDIRAGRLKVV